MLESNPEWDLGGFHVIKFNANNETVTQGLHSGAANFYNVSFSLTSSEENLFFDLTSRSFHVLG